MNKRSQDSVVLQSRLELWFGVPAKPAKGSYVRHTALPGSQPGGNSNKFVSYSDPVGAGEACEEAVSDTLRCLGSNKSVANFGVSFGSGSPGPLRGPSQASLLATKSPFSTIP